jgi:hypothetical protein
MGKSEGEVIETSGNVGWDTGGCAQDNEAVEQNIMNTAVGICSPSQVSLNGWRKAVKDGGASGREKYAAFGGIKDEYQWGAMITQLQVPLFMPPAPAYSIPGTVRCCHYSDHCRWPWIILFLKTINEDNGEYRWEVPGVTIGTTNQFEIQRPFHILLPLSSQNQTIDQQIQVDYLLPFRNPSSSASW